MASLPMAASPGGSEGSYVPSLQRTQTCGGFSLLGESPTSDRHSGAENAPSSEAGAYGLLSVVLGTEGRNQSTAHAGQALANALPSAKEVPGPVTGHLLYPGTEQRLRPLIPRPPQPRKAAASLLTDPETETPEAERLRQGHYSVSPKPGPPPLPAAGRARCLPPGLLGARSGNQCWRRLQIAAAAAGPEPRAWPVTTPTGTCPPACSALTRRCPPGKRTPPEHGSRTAPPLPPAPGTETRTRASGGPEALSPEVTLRGRALREAGSRLRAEPRKDRREPVASR